MGKSKQDKIIKMEMEIVYALAINELYECTRLDSSRQKEEDTVERKKK